MCSEYKIVQKTKTAYLFNYSAAHTHLVQYQYTYLHLSPPNFTFAVYHSLMQLYITTLSILFPDHYLYTLCPLSKPTLTLSAHHSTLPQFHSFTSTSITPVEHQPQQLTDLRIVSNPIYALASQLCFITANHYHAQHSPILIACYSINRNKCMLIFPVCHFSYIPRQDY